MIQITYCKTQLKNGSEIEKQNFELHFHMLRINKRLSVVFSQL